MTKVFGRNESNSSMFAGNIAGRARLPLVLALGVLAGCGATRNVSNYQIRAAAEGYDQAIKQKLEQVNMSQADISPDGSTVKVTVPGARGKSFYEFVVHKTVDRPDRPDLNEVDFISIKSVDEKGKTISLSTMEQNPACVDVSDPHYKDWAIDTPIVDGKPDGRFYTTFKDALPVSRLHRDELAAFDRGVKSIILQAETASATF